MQNELLFDGSIDEIQNGPNMQAGNEAKRHDESHSDHSTESIVYTEDYIAGYKPEVVDRKWFL